MTIEDHHLLCLGTLASIAHDYREIDRLCWPSEGHYKAIRQAIESAEKLGLPVSVKAFDEGKPISTLTAN